VADRGELPAETLPGLRANVRASRPRRAAEAEPVAAIDAVARVLVDTPLAHLDRPFDYAVPASMADTAVPGARVKVRFAGKALDGFVLARADQTEHTGTLTPLQRVVSPEPVLRPAVAELAGVLAERYAGTRSDVLRLAVPPRHATTERQPSPAEEHLAIDETDARTA
jgi:primosomal protein N' (replication factor Y)